MQPVVSNQLSQIAVPVTVVNQGGMVQNYQGQVYSGKRRIKGSGMWKFTTTCFILFIICLIITIVLGVCGLAPFIAVSATFMFLFFMYALIWVWQDRKTELIVDYDEQTFTFIRTRQHLASVFSCFCIDPVKREIFPLRDLIGIFLVPSCCNSVALSYTKISGITIATQSMFDMATCEPFCIELNRYLGTIHPQSTLLYAQQQFILRRNQNSQAYNLNYQQGNQMMAGGIYQASPAMQQPNVYPQQPQYPMQPLQQLPQQQIAYALPSNQTVVNIEPEKQPIQTMNEKDGGSYPV
ncbi:uncharacterized protein MONOS_6826 [Monocercomonoides exilis]|uniref:uncharacterized protein n=1 Tax=Monocercomonoides exilis TaxID=2049356 RepID=UPI00355961F6|nr:hypothetical protein MONOS_6826 [Monocercomonoides exilis]|eukprot:MONOS_6826.1-p1 / transcript=MONOS_6826.1 / gene=MONOS_6826 / organism=Monocercomonoides_exilis_PA203 / gene_product=unspecified product / transcript_product=unspecified product / location=Mono_scaffold00222:65463-66401(-) / protein_length=295 / sequence_SO=supercontig / SO=protein_coding / is_pseudo=false